MDFIKGFLILPRGLRFLLRHRSLWKGMIVPLVVNIISFALSLYFSFFYIADWVDRFIEKGAWYWTAIGFLTKFLVFGVSVALAIVFFLIVGTLLSGPFNDWLGAKTLRLLGHEATQVDGSFADKLVGILRGVVESVKEAAFFLLISGLLFVIGLIPLVGLMIPVIATLFFWYSLAFGTITPCLSDHDLSFREKRVILARNRGATFGFGCSCFLMILIPFAGFFFFPVAVVGGALLYQGYLRRPDSKV